MSKIISTIKSMAIGAFLFSGVLDASGQTRKFSTRCGWLDNPTPANYSLYDKDREWIISVQGGYHVESFAAPAFGKQWIDYFGRSYGYGCACFQMKVDKETSRVLEIRKSYVKPLSVCRKDKTLRKWKSSLE